MEIRFDNISFAYKKRSPEVLKNISVSLSSGYLCLLRGANGSGKTTFGKIILGLLTPNSGNLFFDNVNVKKMNAGKRAERIGYLYQNPDLQLFAPTVWEELCFPFSLTNSLSDDTISRLKTLLDSFEFSDYEERFPLSMSGGEKQRLALATVMSRNIEYLIFDEPTSAVDGKGRKFIVDFINDFVKNGGGALVISHDNEFIEQLNVDRVLQLEGGAITE